MKKYFPIPGRQWWLSLILLSGIGRPVTAQGPYPYNSPDGDPIFGRQLDFTQTYNLYPSAWDPVAPDKDGLMIATYFRMDLTREVTLFTFRNSESMPYLKILYRGRTFVFRRYRNATDYYDYILDDPLFTAGLPSPEGVWFIKLYCTSSFFWIQTTKLGSKESYLSPVYFGLNLPGADNMKSLLRRNEYAYITVGEANSYSYFGLQQVIQVFSFIYDHLRKDIESKFSWPGGKDMKDTEEEDTQDVEDWTPEF